MDQQIVWPQRVAAWISQNAHELIIGGLVAAAAVLVMLVLRQIGRRIVATDPDCRTWRSMIGNVLAKTSLIFMVVLALDTVANYTTPPPKIAHPLDIAFIIVAALQVAVWARELVMGLVIRGAGDEAGETALDNARAVIRVLTSVALFAIAAIVILDNLGVNVTALVAGLGIGGIAIGLAAQGIFSDLFAALAIVFDRPFRRGDTVTYGTTTGTVERIGLKTTRLRGRTGEQVIMANTKLLEQEVRNLGDGKVRRIFLPFSLTYQTPPEMLEKLAEIIGEAVEAVKTTKLIRCVAIQFGPSSIDCELVYDDRTINPDKLAEHKSEIIIGLMRIFAREEIDFAYPTQTTFTAAPDGTLVMPWAPPADPK